jgi:mannitol-1-phosphate/altronate dehydrogenase
MIEVRDPLAAELATRLSGLHDNPIGALDRFLAMPALFKPEFAAVPAIRNALADALQNLVRHGVPATLQSV